MIIQSFKFLKINSLHLVLLLFFFIMKLSISKDGLVNGKENWTDDLSTQQCVRTAVHSVLEELDIKVEEEWEMDDDSIEITI